MPHSGYTICTSEQRLTSTAVSHGFVIERYSSPPFGSHGPCIHSEPCPLDFGTGVPCCTLASGGPRVTCTQAVLRREPTYNHWSSTDFEPFVKKAVSHMPLLNQSHKPEPSGVPKHCGSPRSALVEPASQAPSGFVAFTMHCGF